MDKRRALRLKLGDAVTWAGKPATVRRVWTAYNPHLPVQGAQWPFPPYVELVTRLYREPVIVTYKLVKEAKA